MLLAGVTTMELAIRKRWFSNILPVTVTKRVLPNEMVTLSKSVTEWR